MSYFDDASLVMIPSGYKDQKVYSVKPLDGSGDLDFTRASNATRVDSNGLIEKVRTNLYTYSQSFADASWLTIDATKVSTSATDPNGGNTAANITWTAGSSRYFYKDIGNTNILTVSFWVKSNGGGNKFRFFGNGTSVFSSDLTATSTWTRYSFSFSGSGATGIGIAFASDNSAADLLVAFAQLETGDIATDYIATTSAAVSVGPVSGLPRLDYLNSSCPRLLLEPQRSNLTLYSEQFNVSGWTSLNIGVTANQSISPDGYTNADSLANTSTTDAIDFYRVFTATAASVYTLSCFAKSGTFTKAVLRFYSGQGAGQETQVPAVTFDLANGVVLNEYGLVTDSSITSYGNGWYRLTMTSAAVGTTGYACVLPLSNTATWNTSYQYPSNLGSLGNIQIFGYQSELGAYATSYIPTLSTSVTRVADAASKTGISSLIGQTEGTLFVEAANLFTSGSRTIALLYASGSAYYQIYINSSNQVRVDVNGSLIFLGGSIAANTNYKIAFAYKSGEYALYINGTQIATSTSTTMPSSLTDYYLGNSLGSEQSGAYSQALLFKTRLSNSDLAALTA